jgi:hypothetical protein
MSDYGFYSNEEVSFERVEDLIDTYGYEDIIRDLVGDIYERQVFSLWTLHEHGIIDLGVYNLGDTE